MSVASKTKYGTRTSTPNNTRPNSPELLQKKDCFLTGEKRNIFKLTLTQEESDAGYEQNTPNSELNKEWACNKQHSVNTGPSDTFQKDLCACNNAENIKINSVKDNREDFSFTKVCPDHGWDQEAASLAIKGAAEDEKIWSSNAVEQTKSINLDLKVDNIVLQMEIEEGYIPETVQVNAVEFHQAETEMSQKDKSTLNYGEASGENGEEFEMSKVSSFNNSGLDYDSPIEPQLQSPNDDHSTLNDGLDGKSTAAGARRMNKNTTHQSKAELLDGNKDNSTTLKCQMNGQDCTQCGMLSLNLSDSKEVGFEDDLSILNDGIQLTVTTEELEGDITMVSYTTQPESELEAAGNFLSTLNDANPPGNSYKDNNNTLSHIMQPILNKVKELNVNMSDIQGHHQSKSPQEAAIDDNSILRTEPDISSTDQISRVSLCENGLGVCRLQTLEHNSELDQKESEQSTGIMLTVFTSNNNLSETTAANHASSELPNISNMSYLAVVTPPQEKVSETVNSRGAVLETNNENSASLNQKTILPTTDIINPSLAIMTTPISNHETPTTSQTMPISFQSSSSLSQDMLLSEETIPSVPAHPVLPPQITCLRGYLMKQGGALKVWKQRWFVFMEERNSLVYFRTPQDLTPLGHVCLSHASFTCEEAEHGVFYLHTPERIVTLKAQSEELKFYWLQQLQLRRWTHRPHTTPFDTTEIPGAELFPQLKCVEEVNTEETPSQPLLLQLSLKHPIIELQNSVQILRRRSTNDCSQSVFYIPAPPLSSSTSPSTNTTTNREGGNDSRSTSRKSSSGLIQATPSSSQTTAQTPSTTPQSMPTAGDINMKRRSRSILRRNTSSWSERNRLQLELQNQKDLVAVLQKALELCQSEKRSWQIDQRDMNQSTIDKEDLNQSTGGLEELRRCLSQTQAELEELKMSLIQKDHIILELKKEIQELSEKNHVKQQVIQKLSSCVSQWAEQSSEVDQGSVHSLVQKNLNLQDDLRAFRKQIHFLNSEIHHLSGLWRTSTESQRILMTKVSSQRAQYLRVLRDVQEVSLRDSAQSNALKNIIQEALSTEQSQLQVQVHRDRDQYGFQLNPDFEVEDIKLLIKIQSPDLKSTQIQNAVERPLVARWDQFMSSCHGELSPSPELKNLIRTGIPPHLRPQVWNWIIRTRTEREQEPLLYQQLCKQIESSPQSGSRPWSRQIDLDLPRTLCTNHSFSSPSSPALQQLRRILLAFSWENPSIGYCQGLNRIAGLLLLVLGCEEDSFWALKAVVENIMPLDYYTPSLVGSQADQLVLKDFLAEKLPRLSSHLDRCGVDVSSSTFSWFLVVFVEVLPSHILLPLWDAFLYEGSKVLFRFSLALFKLKESELLQLSTPLELHQYFRVLPKIVPDYRRLSGVAFDELNPFSRRALRNRRVFHLERLQRELSDLHREQSLFLSQRSTRKSTEEETAGVDEEEALGNNSEED